MLHEEISFIFLYVAAFGFSDYFVDRMKFKHAKLLFYYFIIFTFGAIGIYYFKH